jgi:DNA-directed RNA polymerase specialized sigma24 family protein
MNDARDAEDARLLEEGAYGQLVESYYGVILQRCQARVRTQDAFDVAAEAVVRLLGELKRGRRYSVPTRSATITSYARPLSRSSRRRPPARFASRRLSG